MAEDLDKLWETAKPAAGAPENLDALWDKAKPIAPPIESEGFLAKLLHNTEHGTFDKTTDSPEEAGGRVRSIMQGATFGSMPAILGAVEAIPRAISGRKSIGDAYHEGRDEYAKKYNEAEDTFPVENVAGSFAAPIPGTGKLAGTAKVAARLGIGGALGGLHAANRSDAHGFDFARDVGGGFGTGVLGAGLGEVAGAGINAGAKKFSPWLSDFAEKRAIKAAGASKAGLKGIPEARMKEMGRDLLDTGSVGFGDTVEDIQKKVLANKSKYGQEIGDILKDADAASGQDFGIRPVLRKGNEVLKTIAGDPAKAAEHADLESLLNGYRDAGARGMNLQRANELKTSLQEKSNYLKDGGSTEYRKKLASILRREIEDQVESAAGEGLAQDLVEANRMKGNFNAAAKMGKSAIEGKVGNRFLSPSDHGIAGMLGAGMMAHGGLTPGAAAAAAAGAFGNKILRERGPSSIAVGSDKLSKLLDGFEVGAHPTAYDKPADFVYSKLAELLKSLRDKDDQAVSQ